MAADGRIEIDVILNESGVAGGINDINSEVNNLEQNSTSRFGKIGAAMKGLVAASAIAVGAVAGIGVAMGALAAPLVRAAADAQALNAQFAQVFSGIEAEATKALQKVGAETGVMSDRLMGSFVQMAAFAKTGGMDTASALDLTTRATQAAADSAAFYDTSIESVTESLQSYLKGNYANDAALGIASTETTRNAAANKLYGKSFNDLSEAQKQLTLLQMVEDGNKLSGALGQAARETDGLENVMGNLKQAFENIKIALGTPILDPIINGLKFLTEMMKNFDMAPIIASIETFKQIVSDIFTSITENVTSFIATNSEQLSSIGDTFNTIFETIKSIVGTALQSVVELWTTHGESIKGAAQSAFETALNVVQTVLNEIVSFVQPQLAKLSQFWDENGKQITEAVTNAFNLIKSIIETVMPAIKFIIEMVWDAIKQIITGAIDVITGAIKIFSGLLTGDFSKMWEGIKDVFFGAIDVILGWMTLSFVGGLKTLITNFAKGGISMLKSMWDDIAGVFKSMGDKVTASVNGVVTSVVNFFKKMYTDAASIFNTLKAFGAKTFEALKQAVVTSVSNMVTSVINFFKTKVASIKTTMSEMKIIIQKAWDDVITWVKGKVSTFVQIGKDIVNGLIKGITDMGTKAVEAITGVVDGVINKAKNLLGIASPSKLFTQIGEWTGEGLANGVDKTVGLNEKTMTGLMKTVTDVAKSHSSNIAKISEDAAKKRLEIQKEYDKKELELQAKTAQSSQNAIKVSTNKKGETIRKGDEKSIQIRKEGSAKLLKLQEEEQKKLAEIDLKAANDKAKLESDLQKKALEGVKQFTADKKSLNELSIIDEARIWEQSMELFSVGSKERVQAQQEYQKAIQTVNKELTAINAEYGGQIQKVNEDLIKSEETLNKAYEDAVSKRASSLANFKSTFDEYKYEVGKTGDELTTNLRSQVLAFEEWQRQVDLLSDKAINDGLLAELKQMGPNALPELISLNSMTDKQLTEYSNLYAKKTKLAREQAEKEHIGMKKDTEKNIKDLRTDAEKQLDLLQKDWDKKIKGITKNTNDELSTLKQVGIDAGQGLLDGLASKEGALQAKAKQIADTIKNTIQSALDIHSPSRWMRDFVAGNMAKGFVIGIDKNEGLITKASEKLGNLVKPNIVNPLRGVRANLGNLTTRPSVNQSSSNISNDNRRSFAPQIVNHFTPAQSTPSENARKQEQLLRKLAMEF